MEQGGGGEREGPIFRDIRRYYCDYCGISRSKKSLLSSHLLSHHQDEMKEGSADADGEKESVKSNTCEECSASFRKPAHLRQHMLSHSIEGLMMGDLILQSDHVNPPNNSTKDPD